jgi:hypothetical protein
MDVISICPLRVASLLWQARAGVWTLTVVCKATYRLVRGESELADTQDEPSDNEEHWDDDPSRSLSAPADVVPFKPRADILLVGHAYAPAKVPVRSLITRLCVGDIDKSIEVLADRSWLPSGALEEGPRFSKMPLRYERAAAGRENPVGLRSNAPPRGQGGVPLPNLQPPGRAPASRDDAVPPIGFGPLAAIWPERASKLSREAAEWSREISHLHPMPEGIDPSFFNAAPQDQQTETLRANERILLENLHPEHPVFITSLPGLRPLPMVERSGAEPFELPMRGDTLLIDTDRCICALTWRGQLRVESPNQQGRVVIGMVEGAARSSRPDLTATGGAASSRTLGPRAPSARSSPESTRLSPQPGSPSQEEFVVKLNPRMPIDSDTTVRGSVARGTVMPFVQSVAGARSSVAAAPPPPPQRPPPAPSSSTETQLLSGEPTTQITRMPFAGAPLPPPPPPSAPPWSPPVIPAPPALLSDPLSPPPLVGPVAAASAPASGLPTPDAKPKILSLAALKKAPIGAAAAASNAAAAAEARQPAPEREPESPSPRAAPRAVVELLWFDRDFLGPIRKQRPWKEIIAAIKPKPRDADFDAAAPPGKREEAKDRREISGVLAMGDPESADGLSSALSGAIDEDGTFVPPLALVAGELELRFDELETLKATIAAVTPLMAGDKKLKETVDTVNELLRTPWLQSASSVAEGLTAQVKEAFTHGHRVLPPRYLETHTERILLEQRHYQNRAIFGEPWIRGLLTLGGPPAQPIPAYLPASVARELPMFQRFQVRMIAEVRVQLDQYETSPSALRVVALGRVLSGSGRR